MKLPSKNSLLPKNFSTFPFLWNANQKSEKETSRRVILGRLRNTNCWDYENGNQNGKMKTSYPRESIQIHKIITAKLDEIRKVWKKVLCDLTKILAENQKEILKLIAPTVKNSADPQNIKDSDSEPVTVFPTTTLTTIKSKTTTHKCTSVASRNIK